MPSVIESLYSVENATEYKWSSVSGELNQERVKHLRNYLVGKKILDAGCGGGAFVNFLSEQALEVTGLDRFDEFLNIAHGKKYKGKFVQGDITDIPFPDKTFDFTLCYDVLEHVDDLAAVQELARVTKQRLLIAVPKQDDLIRQFGLSFIQYRDNTHLRYYTEESLKNLILVANPKSFSILPELPINLKVFVDAMLQSRYERLIQGRVGELVSNFSYSQRIINSMSRKLLRISTFKELYSGLVAVVDL